MAGSAEKLLLPWAGRFQSRADETGVNELEVESLGYQMHGGWLGKEAVAVRPSRGDQGQEER